MTDVYIAVDMFKLRKALEVLHNMVVFKDKDAAYRYCKRHSDDISESWAFGRYKVRQK